MPQAIKSMTRTNRLFKTNPWSKGSYYVQFNHTHRINEHPNDCHLRYLLSGSLIADLITTDHLQGKFTLKS